MTRIHPLFFDLVDNAIHITEYKETNLLQEGG